MNRILASFGAVSIAAAALAFAPATGVQQQAATHDVSFTEAGTVTVIGGLYDPSTVAGECLQHCETILVEVVQPVADEQPDLQENEDGDLVEVVEQGSGVLAIGLTAEVLGSDLDLRLYESSRSGTRRGEALATSVTFPGRSSCGGVDECIVFDGIETDEDESTRYYLVEVEYFSSVAGYTLDLTYARTDSRNADGTLFDAAELPSADPILVDVADGREAAGDWGASVDPELAPIGSAAGQDFEGASIAYDGSTFTFVMDMTELPAAGGMPEATRYGWSFTYNGVEFELDGKFTNFSRGTCDPTAGNCPPLRNPGVGYFAIRGNCTTVDGANVTTCEELAGVAASFDAATGEISIPIPSYTLAPGGVKACDTIGGFASFIGNSIWAAPSAFVTSTTMPFDDVRVRNDLVVQPADDTVVCG